ncbi:MAG: tetratricopeptide (TPR) repeat protein [Bradymonadia bacterium]|jgi:tetratricopeptide (TPR) repeat protein
MPKMVSMTPGPGVMLSPSDFFVLSRIDGATCARTLAQMVGQPYQSVCEVLVRLCAAGMASVPGIDVERARVAAGASGRSSTRVVEMISDTGIQTIPAGRGAPSEWADMPEAPYGGALEKQPDTLFVREASWRSAGKDSRGDTISGAYSMPGDSGVNAAPVFRKTRGVGLSKDLIPPGWPVAFEQFMFDPHAMSTGPALTSEQKQVVLYYHYHLRRVTYYDLLGIPTDSRRAGVKKSYFHLSKAFHPDRWFRKDVGEFEVRIEEVFKWLNRAYGVLSAPKKRKGYDRVIARGYVGEWELERGSGGAVQPKPESVATPSTNTGNVSPEARKTLSLLLARAKNAQSTGDWESAADLYQRALAVAPSAELRIRLAECMLKAQGDPSLVLELLDAARNEGGDPMAILLFEAVAARRTGDLQRARACYGKALEMEPENPVAVLGLSRLEDEEHA